MKVIEESERSKRKKREREFVVVVVVVVVQPNANGPFVCIRIDDLAFSPTVRPPARRAAEQPRRHRRRRGPLVLEFGRH